MHASVYICASVRLLYITAPYTCISRTICAGSFISGMRRKRESNYFSAGIRFVQIPTAFQPPVLLQSLRFLALDLIASFANV